MTGTVVAAEVDPDHPATARQAGRLRLLATSATLVAGAAVVAVVLLVTVRVGSPSQASPEVGFARDMYTHHSQAVSMALLMRNRVGEPLNTFTEDLITGQAEQQGMLLAWLQDHDVTAADSTWRSMAWMDAAGRGLAGDHGMGGTPAPGSSPAGESAGERGPWPRMPGMATDAELTRLAQARGQEREVLFLRLMIRHHRAGADMAQAYLSLGDDERLDRIAEAIVTTQDREIGIMAGYLADRGAPPEPAAP